MMEWVKRIVTAVILMLFVYGVTIFAPLPIFSLILYIFISLAAVEFVRLCKPVRFSYPIMMIGGFLVAHSFTFGRLDPELALFFNLFLIGLFFLSDLRQSKALDSFIRDMAIHGLVVFYLYFPLYFIMKIKLLDDHLFFFLIISVALGDIGAFVIGRMIGKHPVFPVASPKKTVEGFVAAIVFASVGGWVSSQIFPVENLTKPLLVLFLGGIMGFSSQLSDPVESLFKRAASVKDSGTLLPGHGGFLDRLDSYVFCAPMLYFLFTLVIQN